MGLTGFKKYQTSRITKVIYLLIAASFFIGFGVLSTTGKFRIGGGVSIEGEKVSPVEFNLVLRDIIATLQNQQQEVQDEEFLENQALDILISRKAISKEAEKWFSKIPNDFIINYITAVLGRGQVDYQTIIRQLRTEREALENYVKDIYLNSKVRDMIMRVGLFGSENYYKEIDKYLSLQREIGVAEIEPKIEKINEKDLRSFYERNKGLFKSPESREVWIAKFSEQEKAYKITERKFESFEEFEKEVSALGGESTSLIMGKERDNLEFLETFQVQEKEWTTPKMIEDKFITEYVYKINPERVKEFEEVKGDIMRILSATKHIKKVEEKIKEFEKYPNKTTEDFKKFWGKEAKNIKIENVTLTLPFLPDLPYDPELMKEVSSEKENFIFSRPLMKEGKIYVVFFGRFIKMPVSTGDYDLKDATLMADNFFAKKYSKAKIKPNKYKSLKILTLKE